jgi:hypothetical protein
MTYTYLQIVVERFMLSNLFLFSFTLCALLSAQGSAPLIGVETYLGLVACEVILVRIFTLAKPTWA